jgi:hypothetical protein
MFLLLVYQKLRLMNIFVMYECVELPGISDNMAAASRRNNHHSKTSKKMLPK